MDTLDTVALFCSFGSKFFISGAFSAIYTYVAELYPTSVRTFGLSVGSLGAALGTFLAPFVLSSGKISGDPRTASKISVGSGP